MVLVHEFRQDLEQMAAGAWTVEAVADAITTIGAVDGWQFSKRKTV
ncbi:MAG: hypothetical protein JJU06_06675 [Ectothiorhodospiraceae bacterium]|nr:hypothetical protein [Ectothiorhodospiraceae bacterium]MCH8504724.1 hypothetical protein [Ectothiorhodospiraceae bacterium]